MTRLTAKFEHSGDDDDIGRFHLELQSREFSGRGWMWAQLPDIEALAKRLRVYPLNERKLPVVRWGWDDREGDNLIIGFDVVPDDALGHLRVRVEIADYLKPARRVRSDFVTHYPQLEAFGTGLLKMARQQAIEAVLLGE